ncbi:MAG: Phosphate acyltransferase, partial [Marteilia pararefringens]
EFKPQKGSICVTNHTSPIDALVLSRNQVYSLTGKKFDDIIAYFQQMLSSCANHIWFEREKAEQRHYVVEAMRLHCLDGKNYP